MKKTMILSLVSFMLIFSIPCSANSIMDDSMVYASGNRLNQVYEALQKDSFVYKKVLESYSVTVIKESITPVYTIDLLDYAETRKLDIRPMMHTGEPADDGIGDVYIAKTITSDRKYGGNIMFSVKDGIAEGMIYSPSAYSATQTSPVGSYAASSSYADHAVRIKTALNASDIIPVEDVRYVFINGMGGFFYIKNNEYDILFAVGNINADASDSSTSQLDYSIDPHTELLNIADAYSEEYNKFLAEKTEWEAAHPGKLWNATGFNGVSPIVSDCSQVDNIIDIAEYLNIDYSRDFLVSTNTSASASLSASPSNNSKIVYYIAAGVFALILVSSAILVFRLKSKKVKRDK